jgi:hypothetical protein
MCVLVPPEKWELMKQTCCLGVWGLVLEGSSHAESREECGLTVQFTTHALSLTCGRKVRAPCSLSRGRVQLRKCPAGSCHLAQCPILVQWVRVSRHGALQSTKWPVNYWSWSSPCTILFCTSPRFPDSAPGLGHGGSQKHCTRPVATVHPARAVLALQRNFLLLWEIRALGFGSCLVRGQSRGQARESFLLFLGETMPYSSSKVLCGN